MKQIISKELLSEVLWVEVIKFDDGKYQYPNNDMSKVYYMVNGTFGVYSSINIYELAHKCKEWAWKKGYEINSKAECNKDDDRCGNACIYKCYGYDIIGSFGANSEPEAIFKASQWVLDNKGSK